MPPAQKDNVHRYFHYNKEDNYSVCQLCKKTLKGKHTSNLKSHIALKHHEEFKVITQLNEVNTPLKENVEVGNVATEKQYSRRSPSFEEEERMEEETIMKFEEEREEEFEEEREEEMEGVMDPFAQNEHRLSSVADPVVPVAAQPRRPFRRRRSRQATSRGHKKSVPVTVEEAQLKLASASEFNARATLSQAAAIRRLAAAIEGFTQAIIVPTSSKSRKFKRFRTVVITSSSEDSD